MPATTRRLVIVTALLSAASIVGFVIAYVFQWPSRFVLGTEPDSAVTIADIVHGTPLSIPLPPWIALLVLTALATSRRWWGTIATALLVALGALFVIGGLGEAFGEQNPDVPDGVLTAAGAIWILLGTTLAATALTDLVRRMRSRREHRPA